MLDQRGDLRIVDMAEVLCAKGSIKNENCDTVIHKPVMLKILTKSYQTCNDDHDYIIMNVM